MAGSVAAAVALFVVSGLAFINAGMAEDIQRAPGRKMLQLVPSIPPTGLPATALTATPPAVAPGTATLPLIPSMPPSAYPPGGGALPLVPPAPIAAGPAVPLPTPPVIAPPLPTPTPTLTPMPTPVPTMPAPVVPTPTKKHHHTPAKHALQLPPVLDDIKSALEEFGDEAETGLESLFG